MSFKLLATGLCVALFSGHASATILTFDNLGLPNYGDIPGTYGDNVTSLVTGSGNYGLGNGFTPNVSVEYRTWQISTNTVAGNNLDFWSTDYGDLVNVAYPVSSSDHFAEISLIADAGWKVLLNSFDIAGYPRVNKTNKVRIIDSNNNVLFLQDPAAVFGAGGTHSSFLPNVSADIIRIQFAFNDWNVGIDNVNFDQTSVPVPGAAYLFGSALVGLFGFGKRRRAA